MQNTFDISGDGYGPCSAPVSENVNLLYSNLVALVKNSAKLVPGYLSFTAIPHKSKIVGKISTVDNNDSDLPFFFIFGPIK